MKSPPLGRAPARVDSDFAYNETPGRQFRPVKSKFSNPRKFSSLMFVQNSMLRRRLSEAVDAEAANGPIPLPVSLDHIWGEALQELNQSPVDLRIVNLETAITSAETHWPDKQIHYRMHPQNIGCLSAAKIDACALANNHMLDYRPAGLEDTLIPIRRFWAIWSRFTTSSCGRGKSAPARSCRAAWCGVAGGAHRDADPVRRRVAQGRLGRRLRSRRRTATLYTPWWRWTATNYC